ncbi:hypothetical protein AKJ16_DCAP07363, partial [Drosera capensis]
LADHRRFPPPVLSNTNTNSHNAKIQILQSHTFTSHGVTLHSSSDVYLGDTKDEITGEFTDKERSGNSRDTGVWLFELGARGIKGSIAVQHPGF